MNKHLFVLLVSLNAFCYSVGNSIAQSLKPAGLFCDHMVLQRDVSVPVWGDASPNQKVTVSFAGQSKSTISGQDGKWRITLDPLPASQEGRTMKIAGKTEINIADVVIGEVWICSGQSNMQYGVSNVPEVRGLVPFAKNIRSFEVAHRVALEEQESVSGQWKATHPKSAIAFSFAYFLNDLTDIPVGIIHTSWGSSSIEAWMPRGMTQILPHFKTIMDEFDSDTARIARIRKILASPDGWNREEDIFLRRQPNILYNAIMHPLVPFACRGLVWYQGERHTRYLAGMPEVDESNWFHRVSGMKEYGEVLKEWMLHYRKQWQNDEMNFMVIMLPGYGKGTMNHSKIDPESPAEPSWAWMRESQLTSLELPHTSVVNTIDLGDIDNVHPKDKLPIGQRGALLAAKNMPGQDMLAMGPMLKRVDVEGDQLVVHFDYAYGLKTIDGKTPSGFWITDDSKKWEYADARIEGESVILSSPNIERPKYIRYAFAGKPTVNLVNASELPAYPFRTDNWKK
ncbi:sialate O-acetylesterase [Catalinimonas alkaloidigena]|uniref:sialate O-acetylesterase n=1 Tax=Catalinimonas alkaloidigena TaxID=1075417 RepID=UPI002405D254|nr:sialate O-acetylesterase [Catalinimonas alkaloidigena]MDF9799252.1 sialate O-acetylesterase [Catalinimonas alkaloidigena]